MFSRLISPRLLLVLTALWLGLILTAPAGADLVTWNVNVTLGNGGTATGTIDFSTATKLPTDWNIVVTPGSAIGPDRGYTDVSPYVPIAFTFAPGANQFLSYNNFPDYAANFDFHITIPADFTQVKDTTKVSYELTFATSDPFNPVEIGSHALLLPGYYSIDVNLYQRDIDGNWQQVDVLYGGEMITGGTISSVPLPPSVFLLGSGLIGLAWARRKRKLG